MSKPDKIVRVPIKYKPTKKIFYNLTITNWTIRSSRGGLVVERWSDNRPDSATVDRIPLGAMIYILNKKEYKVYRRVL